MTVQTLHPTKMDNGQILAQTPPPGILIPDRDSISIPALRTFAAQYGAQMLMQTLRDGLFVSPVADLTQQARDALRHRGIKPRHARKLDIRDRHINWKNWDAAQIIRRRRVLGPLWSKIAVPTKGDSAVDKTTTTHKIVWSDQFELVHPEVGGAPLFMSLHNRVLPGQAYAVKNGTRWLINAADRNILKVKELTVAGGRQMPVAKADAKYGLLGGAIEVDLDGRHYQIARDAFR